MLYDCHQLSDQLAKLLLRMSCPSMCGGCAAGYVILDCRTLQPYAFLYNLVPALKPDARVGIVDAFGPTSEHGTPPSLLRCELAAVRYREISLDRLTGSNAYLAIFAPPSIESRTRPDAMVACKTTLTSPF